MVVLASAWKQVSYNVLFFLAGLAAIPRSVLEAAAIDGARPVRRFWTIVFPLLSPTTFFLLVVNVVYAFFDTFGIIDTMTGGGPGQATQTLVYKVYADGRLGGDLGGSAAQSVILMIIVIALTAIQFPLLSPTTFFLLVINVVYAFFDTFGIVDAATQGGPGKETTILVYKVYFDGFKALDLGGSAAQSAVLMVIVITLTVIQFRFVEKKVNY